MNIFEKIVEWSEESKPLWLRDALRRIWLNNGQLTSTDEDEIYELLKTEHGFSVATESEPVPLVLAHGPRSADEGEEIVLLKMGDLVGVNALAAGQWIEFEGKGMTVVYGENASGKTGYGRVMKSACRARGAIKNILGNVYSASEPEEVPEAKFVVSIDGKEPVTLSWKQGEENPHLDQLAKVAVFDSQSARVYLEEKNLLHVPYGLDVFTRLSKLCKDFKARLKQEQNTLSSTNKLPSPAPEVDSETEAGKLYTRITKLTSKSEMKELDEVTGLLETLATLSPQDNERLKTLRKAVEEEPKNKADKLDKLVQRLEKLNENLSGLSKFFSSTNFKSCTEAFEAAKKFAEESKKVSDELFKKEPLPGVGDDPWREMFFKVREYSQKSAYPGEEFPCTKEGALCPTCQQELSEEAKERFKRFDGFINQELSKKLVEMKKTYLTLAGKYEDLDVKPTKNDPALLNELSSVSVWLSSAVKRYLDAVQVWNFKETVKAGDWSFPQDLLYAPDTNLLELIDHLKAESKALRESAKPEEREKLLREHNGFADRKTLSDNKAVLDHYVSSIKSVVRLEACVKDTRETAITDIGKKLTKEIITDKLKEVFNQELDDIGLGEVKEKINMIDTGGDGGAYVRLKLASEQFDQELISDVLCDGELRMVAVASFLAELGAGEKTCTIVFDDPVSSLDHKWRRKAAKRLVREAAKRQVIIFTHDIVFFRYLQQEQEKYNLEAVATGSEGVKVKTQLVEKVNKVPGYCTTEQLPWELRTARKRIGTLKEDLQQIEALHRKGEIDQYKERAISFVTKTRKTWEKAVEGDMLGAMVERFGDDVQTSTLIEIEIDDVLWAQVEAGMGECSELMHDIAAAKQEEMPGPADLQSLLANLEKFLEDVKQRRKVTKSRRTKKIAGETVESAAPEPISENPPESKVKLGKLMQKDKDEQLTEQTPAEDGDKKPSTS